MLLFRALLCKKHVITREAEQDHNRHSRICNGCSYRYTYGKHIHVILRGFKSILHVFHHNRLILNVSGKVKGCHISYFIGEVAYVKLGNSHVPLGIRKAGCFFILGFIFFRKLRLGLYKSHRDIRRKKRAACNLIVCINKAEGVGRLFAVNRLHSIRHSDNADTVLKRSVC